LLAGRLGITLCYFYFVSRKANVGNYKGCSYGSCNGIPAVTSLVVPWVVPFTKIFTPGRGEPVSSVRVPLMIRCWAKTVEVKQESIRNNKSRGLCIFLEV
jgi:hypothetical protein